jgi:hypothetical protein
MKYSVAAVSKIFPPASPLESRILAITSATVNAVGGQLVRIDLDLVLLDKAADGRDLGHARDGFQRVAQAPILEGAKLGQVVPAAFIGQRVFIDPSHSGGVRADDRIDPLGQAAADGIQILDDARARPINVGAILKNDIDERLAEHGFPRTNLTFGAAMNRLEIG